MHIAVLLALLLGPVLNVPAWGFTIIDQRGVAQEFDQPPQRIVSLLPSLTESVCALGQCQRLVGVDRYSNHPESLRRLPQLGGGMDPNIEAIVALQPDVVLLARSSRAVDRLAGLGLKVVTLEPRTQAEVLQVMKTLGLLLGVPSGQIDRRWSELQAGVDAAAAKVPPAARGKTVYFEVSRGPYAAGVNSFIGETLRRLGLSNVVGPDLGPFPRLNPEFVVRANPELIMIGNRSMQDRETYPGWDQITAVRAGRVCVFDAADSDVIARPGPRMDEAAQAMLRCLQRIYVPDAGGRP